MLRDGTPPSFMGSKIRNADRPEYANLHTTRLRKTGNRPPKLLHPRQQPHPMRRSACPSVRKARGFVVPRRVAPSTSVSSRTVPACERSQSDAARTPPLFTSTNAFFKVVFSPLKRKKIRNWEDGYVMTTSTTTLFNSEGSSAWWCCGARRNPLSYVGCVLLVWLQGKRWGPSPLLNTLASAERRLSENTRSRYDASLWRFHWLRLLVTPCPTP